jgi:8-oxo-dGTP diphosphatase
MPVSAAGIAEREGRFLLALRKPGTSIGTSWEFPGGKVEPGEEPREALKREFREELQADIIVEEQICSARFHNKGTEYELQGYRVRLLSDAFVLREHTAVRWMKPEEMHHVPMADSDTMLLRCLEARRETPED